MKEKILIGAVFLLNLFSLYQWFSCRSFKDDFIFSPAKLPLELEGAIHTDQNVPLGIVRLFHNKPILIITEIYKHYLSYLDSRFLISFLSLAGVFGLLCGLFYLFQKVRNPKALALIGVVFILPFIDVLNPSFLPFQGKLLLIAIPYQAISFYGLWHFISAKNNRLRILIVILILLTSIWWDQIFLQEVYRFCVKI